ncbi:hypothetical protein Msil_3006 [Methylocella silvestris BL2]|uniref:Uncharacterized protein n=2 Tax=Methylocella silvestris TaxID=199596 RepID=B8EKN9_METSB|nr:hypothetical protein Msil_3006 [Methylocella silvestris BL2]
MNINKGLFVVGCLFAYGVAAPLASAAPGQRLIDRLDGNSAPVVAAPDISQAEQSLISRSERTGSFGPYRGQDNISKIFRQTEGLSMSEMAGL